MCAQAGSCHILYLVTRGYGSKEKQTPTEFSVHFANAHGLKATRHYQQKSITEFYYPYPFNIASSCLLPVEILIQRLRMCPSSAAVIKPAVGFKALAVSPRFAEALHTAHFFPASLILSTLVSEKPLILRSFLVVVAFRPFVSGQDIPDLVK